MSNTDSFIEEVTEEVNRDKLFATFKRWGWVAGLGVLLVVGGAAYNEWRKAQDRQAAQDFGDQLLVSLDTEFSGDVLDGMTVETPMQAAIAGHLVAAKALASGDTEAGLNELTDITANANVDPLYRELAAFKAALAMPADAPAAERIAAFDAISGAFRILAQEQKALVLIQDGQTDEAATLLRSLIQTAEATPGLQRRASELIVALGADISDSDDDETSETNNDG